MIFYRKLKGANIVVNKYQAIKKWNWILGKLKLKIKMDTKKNQESSDSDVMEFSI